MNVLHHPRQDEAFASFVEATQVLSPKMAVMLGSGMGAVAERVRVLRRVPYDKIPGLVQPTIPGHAGFLTLGAWEEIPVLIFEGRLHYYEGHPWTLVTLPIRVAASLGIRILVFINAAGGIRDDLQPGCLMAIRDQLEWTEPACWRLPGPNDNGSPRPTFYSLRLLKLLNSAADRVGVSFSEGIYAAVTGPTYETPAEIRALRQCGADAVGMSTAREVRAAMAAGLEWLAAISLITNRAAGLSAKIIHHEEVQEIAAAQSHRLGLLLETLVHLL